MTSTIRGASLAFEAARILVPLEELIDIAVGDGGGVGLSAPKISPPTASVADVDVDKLGDLALAEILSHARSGTARVHLPLHPATMKKGPFSLTIPEGAEVVIDLEVQEDVILRKGTRGHIVPSLKLPLGVEIRGVYLDEEGNIVADLAGFPDINLSWLALDGLRVPASLREVLDMIFDEKDTRLIRRPQHETLAPFDGRIVVVKEEVDADGVVRGVDDLRAVEVSRKEVVDAKEKADSDATDERVKAIDLDRLRVQARGVLPHLTPMSLGAAGFLTPGPETVFDIDFTMDGMSVHGDVELVAGELDIGSLKIQDIKGRGSFIVRIDGISEVKGMAIQLDIESGRVGPSRIALKDGTNVDVDSAELEGASIHVGMANGSVTWRVVAKRVAASVGRGEIMMRIGSAITPVRSGPALVSGTASAGNDHFSVDLEVDGVDLEVDKVALALGIAHMDLARVTANATGRVKAGTDFGYTFSGTLAVQGSVDDGHVEVGPIQATLVDGSQGELEITQVAASPDGLDALVARGRLDVRLASGSLPLGSLAHLNFSRGAVGRIQLDDIRINAGERWPHVRGKGNLMARADPVAVKDVVSLPGGNGHVDLGAFELDREGQLTLGALRMWVSTEDGADAPSEAADLSDADLLDDDPMAADVESDDAA